MTEKKPLVCVVDDNEGDLFLVARHIEMHGMSVNSYLSAAEFLDSADRLGCDCLVTDLMMPGINGLELMEEIQARGISVPVVFISGAPSLETAVKAMAKGAFYFLEKTVSGEELVRVVEDAIKGHHVDAASGLDIDELRRLHDTLSPQERELMDLIGQDLSNEAIARSLNMDASQIKTDRDQLMRKMSAQSLAELVRMSIALSETS